MITCPRCGHRRAPGDTSTHEGICPACGIAYAKWLARRQRESGTGATDTAHLPGDETPSFATRLRLQLCAVPADTTPAALWARVALLGALALWTCWFLAHGIDWQVIGGSFLHHVNLAFHEFGHLFFRPFGEFMTILGGSLFQVLLPLALMGVFAIRQHDNFAASVALWWAGQNLLDISPYIRDAEFRALPLVGGAGEASHDWGNLLTRLDALGSCYALARASFTLGALLMLAALGWGAYLLYLQRPGAR